MRRIAALLALVVLTSCRNEIEQSTRPSAVEGTYALKTYGGRPLPIVVSSDANGDWAIVSGELVIGNDQSWSETVNYTVTKGSTVTPAQSGTSGSWVLLSDYAYMIFNDKVYNYQFTGTAAGRSVTLDMLNGNSLVFSQ
jgi:hypothetical protein